jgi:ADP-ribose pyrophosphatase YjhB (NUDIX family)
MPMSDYVRSLREKIGNTLLEVPTVSVAVFDDDGRILMVRAIEDGLWSTPGGMMEPLETPADAAVRETWEETGLVVVPTRIVGVFGGPDCAIEYGNGDRIAWVATLFAARVVGGTPQPDGIETDAVRYVARDAWPALPCRAHVAPFLAAAFDAGDTPWFAPAQWRPPAA